MTCLTNDSKKQSKIGRYQQIHDLNTKKMFLFTLTGEEEKSVLMDWKEGERVLKYLYCTIAEENTVKPQMYCTSISDKYHFKQKLWTGALVEMFHHSFLFFFLALGISFLAFCDLSWHQYARQMRFHCVCVWWLRGWGEAGSNTAQTSSFLHIHDRLSVKHCKDPDLWSVKARVWKIEIPSGN